MKKIIHFLGISATLVTMGFVGNVLALEANLPQQQSNLVSQNNSNMHLRADKNWRRERRQKFIEKLNLTSEQQTQVQNIRSQYRPQIQNLRENIRSERQKLADMIKTNDSYDNLRSQHERIIDLDQQIHSLRFESMLEMREVLTQEQIAQWADLMQERRANRRGQFR